jgi:hypothetical protein
MSKTAVSRVTSLILAIGTATALGALLLAGRQAALSAAAGVAIAIANWQLLRYIVARVVSGNVRNQAAFSFVLVVKMGGLMGLIFLLLHSGLVEPIPFTIGVSSLVFGALLGSFLHVMTAPAAENER